MSVYGTLAASVSARGRALSGNRNTNSSTPTNTEEEDSEEGGRGEEEELLHPLTRRQRHLQQQQQHNVPPRPPSQMDPIDFPSATITSHENSTPRLSQWTPSSFDSRNSPHAQSKVGISPHNLYIQMFDWILCVSLMFTATFSVFVVCIWLTRPAHGDGGGYNVPFVDHIAHKHNNYDLIIKLIDLVLDCVFLADFVLGFFRAFRLDGGRGRMVFELKEIQRLYVGQPGFLMDFFSSIPFDLMVLVLTTLFPIYANSLRFLRLIRLTRMHRAYRIVDQSDWYQRFTLAVDSKKLHMAQLVLGLLLVEHWASCWWVWLGREEVLLEKKRYTWIDRLEENGFLFDRNSEMELYIVGIYWASTVSTSVGSGDVVPANPQEAMFVAIFQIMGGCLFAYAVSSLVGLYAALHALESGRGQAIDSVNEMLQELTLENANVDVEKIRHFVWQACDARAARMRRRLGPGGALVQLSPQLRDEVFLAERKQWMDLIWFLKHTKPRLAKLICRAAKWVAYAPGDFVTLTTDQCLVFTRGVATTRHLVLVRGTVLGIEGLATVPRQGNGPCFLCVSFVEALMFESAHVNKTIKTEGDEYERKRLLRARVRYGLLRWASRVRSVVQHEVASQELAYSMFKT